MNAELSSHQSGAGGRIPPGFRPKAQGCEERATLGNASENFINRNAVAANETRVGETQTGHNPVGVKTNFDSVSEEIRGVGMSIILESEFHVPEGRNLNSRGCQPTERRSDSCLTLSGSNVFANWLPQVSPAAIHVWPLRGHWLASRRMLSERGGSL